MEKLEINQKIRNQSNKKFEKKQKLIKEKKWEINQKIRC